MIVYLDTETHLIAPGALAPKLVCVQSAVGNGKVTVRLASDPVLLASLHGWINTGTLVGHNIAYDLGVLGQRWPELLPGIWRAYCQDRVICTKILAHLVDIADIGRLRLGKEPYSLASVALRQGLPALDKGPETWRLRYSELAGVPLKQWPEAALAYAIEDVETLRKVLWRLTRSSTGDIRDDAPVAAEMPPLVYHEVRAAWGLHLTSAWGMRTDPAAVAIFEKSLADAEELLPSLIAQKFYRANNTRNEAECRAYAELAGVSKRTDGGQISLDAEALDEIDDPWLAKLAKLAHSRKLRSTYLPWMKQGTTAPIHPSYGLAESGRTTCSKPNLQNLPREKGVRECYVPRPGHVFAIADYAIAELVCLAQVLLVWFDGESAMARSLQRGLDLHIVTAADILSKSYDEVKAGVRAGDEACVLTRMLAKVLNFGIPGGLGPDKIMNQVNKSLRAHGLVIDLVRASELRNGWLRTYPEMGGYLRKISVLTRGVWHSKHPITGFERANLQYGSAANHLFQHLCAYNAKRAVFNVARLCFESTGPLSGCRLVAFVHDELILEAPLHRAPEAAEAMATAMQLEFLAGCPDVPIKAEPLLAARWSKEAKPIRDRNGRLLVWGA